MNIKIIGPTVVLKWDPLYHGWLDTTVESVLALYPGFFVSEVWARDSVSVFGLHFLLLSECGVSDHFSVPALDNVDDHVDCQDHSED